MKCNDIIYSLLMVLWGVSIVYDDRKSLCYILMLGNKIEKSRIIWWERNASSQDER